MQKILIVEDDIDIQELLRNFLQEVGYEISIANDGMEAISLFSTIHFDLILLDIMLPKIDGFTVCELIRKQSQIPIIMLTALSSEDEQIRGLDLQVDDYITKPFDSMDLLARVGAVLRRCRRRPMSLNVRNISVDPDQHRVLKDGKEIELTPKEFDLLYYLCSNCDKVLTRKEILSDVWGYNYVGETRTVDIHIQRLRKKLDWEGAIQTITKVGYLLKGSDDR